MSESGYGRYDVMMQPKDPDKVAVIMEFKVFDREDAEGIMSWINSFLAIEKSRLLW